MTEIIFGMWKRKFPILKALRHRLHFLSENYYRLCYSLQLRRNEGEEDEEVSSDEDSDNEDDLGNESDDEELFWVIDQCRNAVRYKGQQEREILMRAMPN